MFDFLIKAFIEVEPIMWAKYVAMWVIGGVLIYLAIKKDMEPALLLPMGLGCILVNIPFTNVLNEIAIVCQTCGAGVESLEHTCTAICNGVGVVAPWDTTGTVIVCSENVMHSVSNLGEACSAVCGGMATENVVTAGIIDWLFEVGIEASEAMPILLFIGIGAMIDFGPLLTNPKLFILGGAAQLGIFITIFFAVLFGFDIKDAASIGIIGAADGPTSILVAMKLGSSLIGPIMVVAYSYMALVPIIQPVVIKMMTTKKERLIRMPYTPKTVSKTTRILFPIIVTVIAGIIAPGSLALIGFLMFGNLLRECGVLGKMTETASNTLANLITLLLGIVIASQMRAETFISLDTLMIIALGLFAFVFDTIAGILVAKLMNVFSKEKINPMLGAAGISAFPMAARTVQKMAVKEDPFNHILMHSIGTNVSGQVASAIVGGLILGLLL